MRLSSLPGPRLWTFAGVGDTTKRDLVVVGASAGGVEALRNFVGGLPADIAGCVLVVLHIPADSSSVLPAILERAGRLPAAHAQRGNSLTPGEIYIAPPNHHLLVRPDGLDVSRGPRENGHRPAVDVLFRSAARSCGPRVIATVLSGSLDDGAAGVRAVRSRGGLIAVQDPDDALYDSMPRHAIAAAKPDIVAPARQLGAIVAQRIGELVDPVPRKNSTTPITMHMENAVASFDFDALTGLDRPGIPSGISCPECKGSLFEINEEGHVRFRCRVGHAWSMVSLLASQDSATEHALWMALETLDEKVALCRRMADMARKRGRVLAVKRYEETAEDTLRAVVTLRSLLTGWPVTGWPVDAPTERGST